MAEAGDSRFLIMIITGMHLVITQEETTTLTTRQIQLQSSNSAKGADIWRASTCLEWRFYGNHDCIMWFTVIDLLLPLLLRLCLSQLQHSVVPWWFCQTQVLASTLSKVSGILECFLLSPCFEIKSVTSAIVFPILDKNWALLLMQHATFSSCFKILFGSIMFDDKSIDLNYIENCIVN